MPCIQPSFALLVLGHGWLKQHLDLRQSTDDRESFSVLVLETIFPPLYKLRERRGGEADEGTTVYRCYNESVHRNQLGMFDVTVNRLKSTFVEFFTK